MDVVLEIDGLAKQFGSRVAVSKVDLAVRRGEILGLLGPNGAGKTTTISMTCGVLPPSSGTARIAGHDIRTQTFSAKRAIGLVPQELALYEDLSARQNLRFFGRLYGVRGPALEARVEWALGVAELADRGDEVIKKFSGGMKRRLNLVASLIHKPLLLILDEPTVGVDPQSRRHIFEAIRALQGDGTTVVYTSHYIEEVEELCDRVAIMDAGQIVASGTLAELTHDRGGGLEVELEGADAQLAAASAAVGALGATRDGKLLRFAPIDAWAPIVSAIEATGARIKRIGSQRADLETVFLALTGRGLRDA